MIFLVFNFFPELFIKNADAFFAPAISESYPDIAEKTFQEESFYIQRHFLPFGRANVAAGGGSAVNNPGYLILVGEDKLEMFPSNG